MENSQQIFRVNKDCDENRYQHFGTTNRYSEKKRTTTETKRETGKDTLENSKWIFRVNKDCNRYKDRNNQHSE